MFSFRFLLVLSEGEVYSWIVDNTHVIIVIEGVKIPFLFLVMRRVMLQELMASLLQRLYCRTQMLWQLCRENWALCLEPTVDTFSRCLLPLKRGLRPWRRFNSNRQRLRHSSTKRSTCSSANITPSLSLYMPKGQPSPRHKIWQLTKSGGQTPSWGLSVLFFCGKSVVRSTLSMFGWLYYF